MLKKFPHLPGALVILPWFPGATCLYQFSCHAKPEDGIMKLLRNVIQAATKPRRHSFFILHRDNTTVHNPAGTIGLISQPHNA